MKKKWYEYLWIFSAAYIVLGFFNILFAWLGIICFITPLLISIAGGGKAYCNRYCGRGRLLELLGGRCGLSRGKDMPGFLKSRLFRYGFLIFFLVMFSNMLFVTYLVYSGAGSLKEVVTLLWTIKLPWQWAYNANASPWIAQFAFGFYSVMLTSTLIGLAAMMLYKPRSWCIFCPMGTMTHLICKAKSRRLLSEINTQNT